MTKKRKRKIRPQYKETIINSEISTADDYINPNATTGPDAAIDTPSSGSWIEQDSTTAPDIDKPSEEENYVASQWALVDKHFLSKKVLPFTLVVIVIGWIVIQDNGAGKLADWNSIWWTIQKCGIILGLFLIILIVQWIYQKIFE